MKLQRLIFAYEKMRLRRMPGLKEKEVQFKNI